MAYTVLEFRVPGHLNEVKDQTLKCEVLYFKRFESKYELCTGKLSNIIFYVLLLNDL